MTQTYQTWFKTVLAANLAVADTTATLATPPTVTKGRMLLKNGNIQEWISFTGVSGSTITGLTRNLSQTADPATGGTGLPWWAGTQIILVAMHDQLPDKLEPTAFTQAITTPDISFTGTTTGGLKVKSLTTAQRLAITPADGHIVYDSTLWENYQYIAWAWSAVSAGSTQPNASTTVAGKVEIATTAESIAGTDTGGTGALLSVLPSDIAKNVQSATFIYGADAGWDDAYVVALTPALTVYTTGQLLAMNVTTANTGACTVDFWPWAKSIKLQDGTDPLDGDVSGTVVLQYDGTNFVLLRWPNRASNAQVLAGTDTKTTISPAQLATYGTQLTYVPTTDTINAWNTFECPLIPTSWPNFANFISSGYGSLDNNGAGFADITSTGVMSIYTKLPGTGSVSEFTTAGKWLRVKFWLRLGATGNNQGWWIFLYSTAANIYADQTSVVNGSMRFVLNGTTLYAHNANGTTATSTDITSGITVTNMNIYEIVYTPWTDIKYYINGNLLATHTTNLPTAAAVGFWYGNSSGIKFYSLRYPIFSIQF